MPSLTTVRFTDSATPPDVSRAIERLPHIAEASNPEQLLIALQEAGRYLGLPLVLLMHFDGPTASLVGLLHGLDGDVDADNLARSAMVASLLQAQFLSRLARYQVRRPSAEE